MGKVDENTTAGMMVIAMMGITFQMLYPLRTRNAATPAAVQAHPAAQQYYSQRRKSGET
jgi:hypothetical protein